MSSSENILDLYDGKAGQLHIEMFRIFPEKFNTTVGNYILMEKGFFVGPNSHPTYEKSNHAHHGDIAEAVLQKKGRVIPDDEMQEAQADNSKLMKLLNITDAGVIFFWGDENPMKCELGGNSGTFHAVSDEADRIRSAQIAKELLGVEVNVVLL
jgi:hypothetical protein